MQTPWRLAAGGDLAYPETTGPRSRASAIKNWYARRVAYASQVDAEINATYSAVQHLVVPLDVLTRPRFVLRVLRQARRRLKS